MAVVVNATETVSGTFQPCFAGWASAHVGKKISKRIAPPLADADTPSTVVFERGVIWIIAALFESNPAGVFWCSSSALFSHT